MRYQVGRACAVAGYYQLYQELDLLPGNIFEVIMSAPVRYRVMDDATRTVKLDRPETPAFLNADTAVLSSLAVCRKYSKQFDPDECYPNITEDLGVDEITVEPEPACDKPGQTIL
ncbi:hypothetical protein VTI28DRAFT_8614 [Corynascus sepedonium]